ncbi:hypothetical protein CK203_107337 [Vitis vinifera]|uniref:Uncharacterized protein n=1 Tax=Vitis vinifera TaxID=29760 RepID=A0A438CDK3_VITVI|nr:hypothetical protein CK203_107337 [Vitis vinifera]
MIIRSLQSRYAKHLMGFPQTDFGSLVQALYGIEEGISRGLWVDSSPSDSKGKKSGSGPRPSGVGTIVTTPPLQPTPPRFRTGLHCAYHEKAGHDTDNCSALRQVIQDLIDQGLIPRPFKLAPNRIPRRPSAPPGYLQHAPPLTLFILFPEGYGPAHRDVQIVTRSGRVAHPPPVDRSFAGTASRDEIQRNDDEILRQPSGADSLAGQRLCPECWRHTIFPSSEAKVLHEGRIITIQSDWDVVTSSEPVLQISHSEDDLHLTEFTFDEVTISMDHASLLSQLIIHTLWVRLHSYGRGCTLHGATAQGQNHAPHIEGIVCILEAVEVQDLQRTLDRCIWAVFDYDILVDTVIDVDGVTLPDSCTDEMDMIGVGRIFDAVPHGPHSDFDLFGVSMIDTDDVTLYDACTDEMDMIDDDDFASVVTTDVITVEATSNFVDPPLSFNTMSGFVTHFDDVAGGIIMI